MLTVFTIVLALAACGSEELKRGGSAARAVDKKYKIATVVKVDGIPWFARMREGVKRFARETGHEAFTLGPAKGDGALQARMIEELLSQPLDAICVVPFWVSAFTDSPYVRSGRLKPDLHYMQT